MDDNERLRVAVRWGRKPRPVRAEHLGSVLGKLMDRRVSPQQALKVLVDSPSYAHELRMCCPELLEELRQECPRARIKKIRVVIS